MKQNLSPVISLITPVRNIVQSGRVEFLKQNLENIHNQTYPHIEHIIQDGNSNDGTLELLQEYVDKGWIKLYSEPDTSMHDAINKAVLKSTGKYIGILGSDDYYKENDIVEHIVTNYLQDEHIDYVYGDEEHISFFDNSYIKTWLGNAYENNFWRGTYCATEAMLFSRRIFDEVGMFDLKYPVVADLKLQMAFKLNDYKGVYCHRTIDVFRQGGGVSSRKDTLFYHTKEFAEICANFWKNFDNTMTPEKAEYMIKYDEYSEEFLMKLRRYLLNLKLKNVDYVSLNKYIENMILYYYDKKRAQQRARQAEKTEVNWECLFGVYPFRKFPLVRIVKKSNCKKIYVLGKIPLLKIWTK